MGSFIYWIQWKIQSCVRKVHCVFAVSFPDHLKSKFQFTLHRNLNNKLSFDTRQANFPRTDFEIRFGMKY